MMRTYPNSSILGSLKESAIRKLTTANCARINLAALAPQRSNTVKGVGYQFASSAAKPADVYQKLIKRPIKYAIDVIMVCLIRCSKRN